MRRPEEEVITRKVEATGFSAAGKGQTGQLGMPGRVPILDQNASSSSRHRRRRRSRLIFRLALLALLAAGVLCELSTSRLQSIFLAAVDDDLSFSLGNGPSTRIRFPAEGPYDRRLGYARLPQMLTSLERAGFRITRQARLSDHLLQMIDAGVFPTYREKMQAGLRIVGRRQRLIHRTLSPFRVYKTFDEIPDLVIRSLLYVEDRSLLDTRFPHRNPVVAWPRLGHAVLDLIADGGPSGRHPIGGSTLATQIEKFRHARDGRTRTPGEKIQQMISAMLRVYLDGDRTTAARRRILRDYLNSVPLAALPQVGEIFGMGDGLAVWYGADLDETDDLLRAAGRWAIPSGRFRIQADLVHAGLVPGSGREGAPPPQDEIRRLLPASSTVHEQAAAFRRILSLILAHRRPTVLLNQDRNQLQDRVDDYLHLMARDGIITAMLRDEALKVRLDAEPVEGRKCGSAVRSTKIDRSLRAHLKAITGLASRYDLDHLDLTVGTTVDAAVQADVDDLLHRLSDPVFLRASGLTGRHLVDGGDPAQIVYGFTLYQRGRDANLLRVEADTYDHPFNVNEGLKLDLGSTAKLRTLISYLSIIARIHADYGSLHTADLGDLRIDTVDELTHWGVDYLKAHPGASLEGMLEAAMDRKYSASPRERFFTGGGLHRFSNFSHASDGRILTVRQAFARSVNLVFVRIMRDVINHLMVATAGAGPDDILAAGTSVRRGYLVRYARREGLRILQEAYRRLSHGAGRAMEREKDPIGRFLRTYLKNHPDAGWRDVVKDTEEVRQESLAWILRTRRKRVRDRAIRITLEVDAFRALGDQWRELGYPFERLVPSLATALGSSADRPDSLALLAGIIQNDGVRLEIRRIESFKFGEATPYETHLAPRPGKAIRVMPREVAEVVWKAMRQVVVAGTARRLDEAETLTDGSPRVVAGKTGTGDHRFRRFDSRGNEVSSRPVDRAATFVFTLGDRFFGTVTAYVAGQESGSYQFTSALPVALLGVLLPHLEPLLAAGEALPAGDPRGHARRKTAPWGNVWNPELKADLLTAQPRAGI